MADRWKPCAKCGALVLRPDSTDDSDSTCDACRNSNSGSATSPAVREVERLRGLIAEWYSSEYAVNDRYASGEPISAESITRRVAARRALQVEARAMMKKEKKTC